MSECLVTDDVFINISFQPVGKTCTDLSGNKNTNEMQHPTALKPPAVVNLATFQTKPTNPARTIPVASCLLLCSCQELLLFMELSNCYDVTSCMVTQQWCFFFFFFLCDHCTNAKVKEVFRLRGSWIIRCEDVLGSHTRAPTDGFSKMTKNSLVK